MERTEKAYTQKPNEKKHNKQTTTEQMTRTSHRQASAPNNVHFG